MNVPEEISQDGYWEKRKAAAAREQDLAPASLALEDLQAVYPTLRAFLVGGFVGGSYVAGGTLLISVSSDGAKIGLHDREIDKWTWRTHDEWEGLLEAAEEAAGTDPSLWRKSKQGWRQR